MIINLTAPRNWNELSEQQVVYVARVLSQKPTKEELLTRCFLKFTGLHPVLITRQMRKMSKLLGRPVPFLYRYKRKVIALPAEDVQSFCSQLEYLTGEPGLMKCPARLSGLYGPDVQLWTVSFEAYLMADRFYRAYSQSKDTAHLYSMIGVLWRKKGAAYSDSVVERNARKIRRHTTPDECNAVFLWWTGIKLWLKEKYPDLFTAKSPEDTEEQPDESYMVMNMLYAITEGRAHENKQVFSTPVHEVLHALNTKAKQIHEMNAKTKT